MADDDEQVCVTIATRSGRAREAADRWRETYYLNGVWRHGDDKRQIWERLVALSPPTPEAVNDAIGNNSWTACECDHCGLDVDAVAQMGEEPDYESSTAHVCLQCLRIAVATLAREPIPTPADAQISWAWGYMDPSGWWLVEMKRGEPSRAYHPDHGWVAAYRDTFSRWHLMPDPKEDDGG